MEAVKFGIEIAALTFAAIVGFQLLLAPITIIRELRKLAEERREAQARTEAYLKAILADLQS